MTLSGTRRDCREIWRPAYLPKHTTTEGQIIDDLDDLMARVVAEHLMSEVPLGAFLSGGIDSSLVVAYASKALSEPLTTFSIGVHDESQSELPWAREVAERYRTNHTETIVDPDLAGLTPRMVATLEEPVDPFGDGLHPIGTVVQGVHARHDGEQRLGGADVRGGPLAPDVLFASLQRHAIGRIPLRIFRHADDPARHLALEVVAGREKGGVGTAVSHGYAETLG